MTFIKGQSGNPAGRPSHTASREIREQLRKRKKDLIEEIFEQIDQLEEPGAKLPHLFKMMEFLYSKPKDIDVTLEQAIEIIKDAIANGRTQQPSTESPRLTEGQV